MHSRRQIEGCAREIKHVAVDLMAFLSTINSHFTVFKWVHYHNNVAEMASFDSDTMPDLEPCAPPSSGESSVMMDDWISSNTPGYLAICLFIPSFEIADGDVYS
jgi:hypothetical protein